MRYCDSGEEISAAARIEDVTAMQRAQALVVVLHMFGFALVVECAPAAAWFYAWAPLAMCVLAMFGYVTHERIALALRERRRRNESFRSLESAELFESDCIARGLPASNPFD